MEGQKQGRPGGLNSLFIHIHGYDEPVPPPAEQRKKFVMEYLNLLDGPFVNKASGMREWRAKNGGPPLFFAREDSDFRASDGLEPLVNCDYARTKEMHSCTGGGAISSTLRYSYRFYPLYFAEWPAMDIAVRKLIESMVVKGE